MSAEFAVVPRGRRRDEPVAAGWSNRQRFENLLARHHERLRQALLLDATIEFFSYGLPASRWPSLGNLLADVTNSGGLGLSGYQQLG